MELSHRKSSISDSRNGFNSIKPLKGIEPYTCQPMQLFTSNKRLRQREFTNRRRNVFIDYLDEERCLLTIETELTTISMRHNYSSHLITPSSQNEYTCHNAGVVTKRIIVDLIKPIYTLDLPSIVEQVQSGIELNQVRYSEWSLIDDQGRLCLNKEASMNKPFANGGSVQLVEPNLDDCKLLTRMIKYVQRFFGC